MTLHHRTKYPSVAVIGGGPAGLMATEVLASEGIHVDVYDAMPSVGRKFLMAGKGGMNITYSEPLEVFLTRYGASKAKIEPLLRAFPPEALREWIRGLGIETFVGSSGRVFPADMKAGPLLRAWLHRLRERGVNFHVRHRWCGWDEEGKLQLDAPAGQHSMCPDAVVLALGGASWPQLGSDAAWVQLLTQCGIEISRLRPANCGFNVAWSAFFRERFAGAPLKSVAATFGEVHKRGECVITGHGIEGSLIYAFSAALRNEIEKHGHAHLYLDLLPDWTLQRVQNEVAHPRGSRSLGSHLHSRLGLKGAKSNLLREVLSEEQMLDSALLAATIKSLRLQLNSTRPLNEAISTAGGIAFAALDENLMLKSMPGVFCAGEMLDWEAPTGGYLLTACFASGHAAGKGLLNWSTLQKTADL